MKRNWKTLKSKTVYKNKWLSVIEDDVITPGGHKGIYGYLDKSSGIYIIAEDSDGSIFLIKEYRYVLKEVITQIQSGTMNSDDFTSEAKRELEEETGIIAGNITYLGDFYMAPGHETTKAVVVLATDLDVSNLKTDDQDSDESIMEIFKVNIEDLKKLLLEGKIKCGITIAALNLYFLYRKL